MIIGAPLVRRPERRQIALTAPRGASAPWPSQSAV